MILVHSKPRTLLNPLCNEDENEMRRRLVRMSTYVANMAGMEFCMTKCDRVNEPHGSDWYTEMGPKHLGARCCSGCNSGYLNEKETAVVKEELNIEPNHYGFWDPNKGCRLPRLHRPEMCLRFYCGKATRHLSDENTRAATMVTRQLLFHPYTNRG